MLFRQLFDQASCTYSYLIADFNTKDALLIDSVQSCVERDLRIIQELGLSLIIVADTHIHADHITGMAQLKEATGAQICVPTSPEIDCADRHLAHGDTLTVGGISVRVLSTPGHTHNDICFYVNQDRVLTGDTLFIRGCGRTDFQSGDPKTLYHSVHEQLYTLPDETLVFPGHDYKGETCSTIGEEKLFNPRLNTGNNCETFVDIMNGLNLPYPKQIDTALPHNLKCGHATDL